MQINEHLKNSDILAADKWRVQMLYLHLKWVNDKNNPKPKSGFSFSDLSFLVSRRLHSLGEELSLVKLSASSLSARRSSLSARQSSRRSFLSAPLSLLNLHNQIFNGYIRLKWYSVLIRRWLQQAVLMM